MPILKNPWAWARTDSGKLSEIIEVAAGAYPASPIPTNERIPSKDLKLPAKPEAKEVMLQKPTLKAIIVFLEYLSAKIPKGKLAKELQELQKEFME